MALHASAFRSDARARTKQLVTEVGNRKKLNRNPTAFFLLTSYLFPLTCLLQQVVVQFDYSVSKSHTLRLNYISNF